MSPLSLSAGSRLANYEILEPIGAGGMGEVYRARDTKLGRDVAIKVLPDELAQVQERLDRFEREAKLLAALNHANVATLYGLEHEGDRQFLIMELVEGETLAERIERGPIPFEEAQMLFVQIAEGLEAAHEKGIVHRDFKPANIKITPEGKIKILDFGLAKAFIPEADVSAETSQSPTLTKGTALGAIMGTAGYMSPEQARGKLVDRRTDVWAFGCCFYEALTGRRAFEGETVPDTLTSVLGKEPDWTRLPATTPARVRDLLARLLRKDMNIRVQHVGDARIAILEASGEEAAVEGSSRSRKLALALVVAVAAGFLLRSVFAPAPSLPSPPRPVRLSIDLPDGHELVVQRGRDEILGQYPPVAISPDGTLVAFGARDERGVPRLYLRSIDSLELRVVPGSEKGELPFFSPDGQWIGFLVEDRVSKARVDGGVPGVPVPVGKAPRTTARGIAWALDGTIVLGGMNHSLTGMDAETGETELLTELDASRQENYHAWPFVLPDGEHVLFTVETPVAHHLAVLSLETRERHVIEQTEDATQPHYVDSGHLVFFRRGGLFAAPFSLSRFAIVGTVTNVPVGGVVEGWNAGLDQGYFAASLSGSLVLVPGTVDLQENRVVRVGRSGTAEPLSDQGRYAYLPDLSPDGSKLIASDSLRRTDETDVDLFVHDLARGTRARMTPDGASINPVWSADGERIYFARFGQRGDADLYWMPSDGSGALQVLTELPFDQYPTDVSPDGKFLTFEEVHPDSGFDIHIMSLDGGAAVDAFAVTSAKEFNPSFSPDSRFVAYVSNESGRDEVYVRPLAGDGAKIVVSTSGGLWPRWSPKGDELFYMQGTTMMAVPVVLGPSFRAGSPAPLFEGNYTNWFEVFPDGEHFAMITFPEVALQEIELVVNWSTELAELVPP